MNILSSSKKIKESKVKDYIVENQERFYKIAYSYVKNEDDALDIVHDAICKALQKIDTLKNIEVVKTWFYKILVNSAIDYIRKNNKYVSLSQEDMINEKISNDIYSDIDLEQALDRLPEEYKSIIMLRYFEDMKIEEIANVLQQNINTVKTKLYKGLRRLKIKINTED
ncbi:RNA polymerase sigma-70 factor [[Clostridium] sordellii]|uniref:RNA polymerase sigma-70 factor n=1 Tax=Paraclostridium sordellii TaxID=1505 RepID=A0A0A1SHH3_PARSO|nr:sigma-70 family RNA polymerase sigma factor [Paeniclostridium sordellii]MDU5020758.1 sigma-70 family RNA polymerase sigma factor [Clostridiales bacterium]AUN13647.1 RNA polymerase subunit sigma-70 [Paeniclostridium sordellii]EPZ57997.1 RNA polymerase sigma factor sigV [[Clostridium] sordellii VPI 9048] [Paeniclostridium sordellii VPI 9048]MBS6023573.1 sigma-70 family RNA polymerase sigma factor [Paeniclostridium sordellii]MBX9180363.1 sigma-70 family RNA polymerase sigma factor [Paeniclostr